MVFRYQISLHSKQNGWKCQKLYIKRKNKDHKIRIYGLFHEPKLFSRGEVIPTSKSLRFQDYSQHNLALKRAKRQKLQKVHKKQLGKKVAQLGKILPTQHVQRVQHFKLCDSLTIPMDFSSLLSFLMILSSLISYWMIRYGTFYTSS